MKVLKTSFLLLLSSVNARNLGNLRMHSSSSMSIITNEALSNGFYLESPLTKSEYHSSNNNDNKNKNVYYKMDYLQPSGSFKDRGIGHMIATLNSKNSIDKLICSSGGNAGHAVATVGKKLGVDVDVFVPTTTKEMMINKLKKCNANVIIHGDNWNTADNLAREEMNKLMLQGKSVEYIPPFDHPLIWEGHSSIIDELQNSINTGEMNDIPDAIVVSVGGGGLLRGIQLGLERHNWYNTKIIACETSGCASFKAAIDAGKVVSINSITSIATSLGALAVTKSVLNDSPIQTQSLVVSDREAIDACKLFKEQYDVWVEPSCGASLSVFNNNNNNKNNIADELFWNQGYKNVVVVVCGGNIVNDELMTFWDETV